MQWSQYAKFGATILWDQTRSYTYWANGLGAQYVQICAPECDPYTVGDCSPAPTGQVPSDPLDPAPWFDPLIPQSAGFGGLWVTSILGAGSTWERTSVERAGGLDGARFSRGRRASRDIVIEGFLLADDCCSAAYGLRWLASALRDPSCGAALGCDGNRLTVLDCCDAETFKERWRELRSVALVEGPVIVGQDTETSCACGCAPYTRVRFVLRAGNPSLWLNPDVALDQVMLADGEAVCELCPPTCVETSCADDPLCPEPVPPSLPIVVNDCVCWPLVTRKQCADLSLPSVSRDAAIIVEITTGAEAVRNLRLDLHPNPAGLPCDQATADPCTRCASLAITYVPPYSTLFIDGRDREATLICQGASRSGDRNIGSPDGVWPWPTVDCTRWCVCIVSDAQNTPPDLLVTVATAEREL
jgi:hypothetical protein